MTSFALSQWNLLSGSTAIMEAARAQAIADAAAEAEANNIPLIATVPEGTPNPEAWIGPDADLETIVRAMSCPPSCPEGWVDGLAPAIVSATVADEPTADKLRRLASPLWFVIVAGVVMVGISMAEKPGRGESFR